MAINARLSYNSGTEYVDLFPRTNVEALVDGNNLFQYTTIQVNIPVVAQNTITQTIDITTTDQQVNSPVFMSLNTTGEQAQSDYSTITQYEVQENQLIITRLYNWPTEAIDVTLLFQERRG